MVLICLCLLVYDCSEVRLEVRPDGWISVASVFSLPSFPKLLLFCFLPSFLWTMKMISILSGVLAESVLLLAVPLALIYAQPDMKNTITVTIIFCILLYIAGLSYKIIGGAILIAGSPSDLFLSIVVQPDQTLIKDYQRTRIMSFPYPENEEYQEDIEQQNNSKTAIASGELVGKKLTGDDQVSSVNAGNFVAENQTDFIFAVAGEEYGFIGCTTLVVLLLLISVECIRMSLRAKDLAGKIICCWNWQCGSYTEFFEYLRCYWTGT